MSRLLNVSCLLIVLLYSISLVSSGGVSGSTGDTCNGADYGSAGDFDFYVVQQSWPAEFCYSHSSYPGCENPTNWQQNNLTLHGVWPNYNVARSGHDWPQCCSSKYGTSITQSEMESILSELQTYWPSEQDPAPSGDWSSSLWEHEWNKHGTCSGLGVTDYFQHGINIMQQANISTPSVISSNIGGSTTAEAIQSAFNNGSPCGSGACLVGVTCSGSYLEAITTCWSKDLTQQLVCPASVIGKQCSGTISIDSFSSSNKRTAKLVQE